MTINHDRAEAIILNDIIALQDMQRDLVDRFIEQVKSYSNVVITTGYAGFFAIWVFIKDGLSSNAQVWSALLMGLSIVLFVLFVMIDTLFLQWIAIKLHSTLPKTPLPTSMAEIAEYIRREKQRSESAQLQIRKNTSRMVILWPFFFIPSVVSGFSAGILLIYNCFAKISGFLPMWPT